MSKTILITGAGSGFGEGAAIGMARNGHHVIATAQISPQVTPAAHGLQKLFGWFGGLGLERTSEGLAALGFIQAVATPSPPESSRLPAVCSSHRGLVTPLADALTLSVMIVAAVSVHLKNGFIIPRAASSTTSPSPSPL